MKIAHYTKYKTTNVTDYGSEDTTIRVFITEDEAPNFIMRRFDIHPNGRIGVHSHPAEHEIYVIKGNMLLLDANHNESSVREGDFIFISPNEKHGYRNNSGETCSFICTIPKPKNEK